MSRHRPSWGLICALLCWPLAGCESHSDSLRFGELLYDKLLNIGSPSAAPRDQVQAIPFATLGVRLGSSDEAILVLESQSGDTLQFVGGTVFAIATRNGRILRTVGFKHNLSGLQEEASAPTETGSKGREFRYDLADKNAYGVAVHCTETDAGTEQIEIVGDVHLAKHVIEDCTAPELDWSFRNEFWKDKVSDFVWRSVQYVHPDLDPLTLETLRPAG